MKTTEKSPILRRRINAVYLFDAQESACNGEPNDDGRPRQDPETERLWWNDSALKRFLRDSMLQRFEDAPGHRVLVQHGYPLNRAQTEAFAAIGQSVDEPLHADGDGAEKTKKQKKPRLDDDVKRRALAWICREFGDVRTFGGVMDTGYQLGNVTGPIQFQIARAVHPVRVVEAGLTRVSVTTEKDLAENKDREMGTKYVVPFALFRGTFCFTPSYGVKAGFTVDDLRIFLDLLKDPFIARQSASLGTVTLRKCWLFLHETPMIGDAQNGALADRISVTPTTAIPQSWRDFDIRFDDAGLSKMGVQVYTEESYDALVAEVTKRPGKAA